MLYPKVSVGEQAGLNITFLTIPEDTFSRDVVNFIPYQCTLMTITRQSRSRSFSSWRSSLMKVCTVCHGKNFVLWSASISLRGSWSALGWWLVSAWRVWGCAASRPWSSSVVWPWPRPGVWPMPPTPGPPPLIRTFRPRSLPLIWTSGSWPVSELGVTIVSERTVVYQMIIEPSHEIMVLFVLRKLIFKHTCSAIQWG